MEQIKRASYALYIYLNNSNNHSNPLLKHIWGTRKVSVRSIILMINNKPGQEFQFVKILTLNELLGYIQYFKPVYSNDDVQAVLNMLN